MQDRAALHASAKSVQIAPDTLQALDPVAGAVTGPTDPLLHLLRLARDEAGPYNRRVLNSLRSLRSSADAAGVQTRLVCLPAGSASKDYVAAIVGAYRHVAMQERLDIAANHIRDVSPELLEVERIAMIQHPQASLALRSGILDSIASPAERQEILRNPNLDANSLFRLAETSTTRDERASIREHPQCNTLIAAELLKRSDSHDERMGLLERDDVGRAELSYIARHSVDPRERIYIARHPATDWTDLAEMAKRGVNHEEFTTILQHPKVHWMLLEALAKAATTPEERVAVAEHPKANIFTRQLLDALPSSPSQPT